MSGILWRIRDCRRCSSFQWLMVLIVNISSLRRRLDLHLLTTCSIVMPQETIKTTTNIKPRTVNTPLIRTALAICIFLFLCLQRLSANMKLYKQTNMVSWSIVRCKVCWIFILSWPMENWKNIFIPFYFPYPSTV